MASGKSSIAQVLVDAGYTRISFAQPLKNVAELAYGPIDKSASYSVTSLTGQPEFISGREILQGVGQSVKTLDRDFWLRCFFRTANKLGDFPLVVDDGRFRFERDALREKGWLIVGLQVPEDVRKARYLSLYGRYPTDSELNHPSETEIPDILAFADYLFDGTRSALENGAEVLYWAKRDTAE